MVLIEVIKKKLEGESSTLSKIHVGDLAWHGMGLFWDLKVIFSLCQDENLQKILIYISNKTCLNNRKSLRYSEILRIQFSFIYK